MTRQQRCNRLVAAKDYIDEALHLSYGKLTEDAKVMVDTAIQQAISELKPVRESLWRTKGGKV